MQACSSLSGPSSSSSRVPSAGVSWTAGCLCRRDPGCPVLQRGFRLILIADSLALLLGASILYGLGAGLLLPALMTWMLNVVRADRRSAASATFYNMLDIGTSTGILVLGSLAGSIGYIAMYQYVLAIMGVFLVFGIVQHHSPPCAANRRNRRSRGVIYGYNYLAGK